MDLRDIKRIISESSVQYLLLQFTDVLGNLKGVEVGSSGLDHVLTKPLPIDASSVIGRFRTKETDGCLRPDPDTFAVLPFDREGIRGARLISDLIKTDGEPDNTCPRQILRTVVAQLKDRGLEFRIAPEVEFYIFQRTRDGGATLETNDASGYFDFVADEPGHAFRRELVSVLEQFGMEIRQAHHEAAPGQHEIDLGPLNPLACADSIITLRYAAKALALKHGLIATFMPKPIYATAGSGMHLSFSVRESGADPFAGTRGGLSRLAKAFIGGVLAHAEGLCMLLNPLVNSYKRLVPGHEAPTHVYWSRGNIEPYLRVPDRNGGDVLLEVRSPDPSCNPYLSIAALLAAGFDGVETNADPGEPIEKELGRLSGRERARLRVKSLPQNLGEAIEAFGKDRFHLKVLGPEIARTLMRAKREEWESYIRQVHPWELDNYLATT
ncbi:MAG: glutamine synthetase family protein [Deltaproteobacteria bacterium]|nr:glutamine synthetase family protein [Deltaproteobacteria bacterium]